MVVGLYVIDGMTEHVMYELHGNPLVGNNPRPTRLRDADQTSRLSCP